MNKISSLLIVSSIHYNVRGLICKSGSRDWLPLKYKTDIVPTTTTFIDRINRHFCVKIIAVFIIEDFV